MEKEQAEELELCKPAYLVGLGAVLRVQRICSAVE